MKFSIFKMLLLFLVAAKSFKLFFKKRKPIYKIRFNIYCDDKKIDKRKITVVAGQEFVVSGREINFYAQLKTFCGNEFIILNHFPKVPLDIELIDRNKKKHKKTNFQFDRYGKLRFTFRLDDIGWYNVNVISKFKEVVVRPTKIFVTPGLLICISVFLLTIM